MKNLERCTLCPRACTVNRLEGQRGRCHVSAELKVARAALHMWEEPCISGKEGSGAVFFSGCSLGCIYCQNRAISGGESGAVISIERLAEIFLELQEQNANNINLVTAGHYVPQIILALQRAKDQGLTIPIIYNSSGYEKTDTLKSLEGLIDVYLPDFKYMEPELAAQYSHAPDYPEAAKAAIAEMVRQCPQPRFVSKTRQDTFRRDTEPQKMNSERKKRLETDIMLEPDDAGTDSELICKGVIVRHLLLPGHVKNAKAVVQYLHETYGDQIYISMMNQYTPVEAVADDPLLGRKVTKREYRRLLDFAEEIGVTQGFYQEGGTAMESFIPAFDCEGVLKTK